MKKIENYSEGLTVKEDVRLAYIKLFGEEQAKVMLDELLRKKAEIMKGRNYDNRRNN